MTICVIIKGLVQGVWFRDFIKEKAEELHITGWVKNTSDGSVAAEFSGNESSIKKMIAYCNQGPTGAEVSKVLVDHQEEKTYKDFQILSTE